MKKRRQAHNHPEMTPLELARCRPAAEVDQLGLPIPTHLVSNEEYFPPFLQTAHQQQVEARVLDALDEVPNRLNISRRRFLTTSAGLAASFVALNEVFRDYAFGDALFRVGKEAGFDYEAFAADGPPFGPVRVRRSMPHRARPFDAERKPRGRLDSSSHRPG